MPDAGSALIVGSSDDSSSMFGVEDNDLKREGMLLMLGFNEGFPDNEGELLAEGTPEGVDDVVGWGLKVE